MFDDFDSIVCLVIWCVCKMLLFSYCFCADYENYHPKNKKKVPKGNNQKSGSKGMIMLTSSEIWIQLVVIEMEMFVRVNGILD